LNSTAVTTGISSLFIKASINLTVSVAFYLDFYLE